MAEQRASAPGNERRLWVRTANSLTIGPLTIYRWSKGPTLSIESWSHPSGTSIDSHIGQKRSFHLTLPLLRSEKPVCRIQARRWFR